jgi:hypothetical protein
VYFTVSGLHVPSISRVKSLKITLNLASLFKLPSKLSLLKMPGRRSIASPQPGPSTQRQPLASGRGRDPAIKLPQYEPLNHPFRMDAILNLEKAERKYENTSWRALDEQCKSALELLTECGEQINELVHEREQDRAQLSASQDDGGEALRTLEGHVNKMSERMDQHARKTIDVMAETAETKVTWSNIIRDHKQRAAALIEARSQRAMQRRNDNDENEDEDEENLEASQMEETQMPDPDTAPSAMFSTLMDSAQERYELKSLSLRYAEHNDYISFKRSVFEARNGMEAALPHPSTWFKQRGGSPLPGTAMQVDDSDDDVQLTREKISTKCPLSLMEMKEPISNKACQHICEASVLREYLNTAPWAGPAGRMAKYSKPCPAGGCNAIINIKDLYEDKAMIRRIKRIQAYNQKSHTQAIELDRHDGGWAKVDEEEDDDDPMDED